ncbi:MAG: CRTAC1 family protein [Saprospirales bacterium]|nr:CRTAC1 family protein [Saprospirales bacterium]
MRFFNILSFFVLGLFFLLSACQMEAPQGPNGRESHLKMISLLDSLSNTANPDDNIQMNARRAENLKKKVLGAAEEPEAQFYLKFKMAYELLNAGQTEEALQVFTDLAKEQPDKTVYDMLAVGYLRLGEQQNHINNRNSASCIIPIAPEGWHKLTIGAESAIRMYEKILNAFPEDLSSRYLMNIGYMTLGQFPFGVPEKYRIPKEAFSSPNSKFPQFKDVAVPLGLDVTGLSGGVCMEDFNNDGFLDLFMTSLGLRDQVRLFMADGKGGYRETTEEANLKGITCGVNALHVDYNNDGWVDIFILRGGGLDRGGELPNSLLRNNGDGTFSDVTFDAGLLSLHPTMTASWADFNRDGWLDLFIGNESKGQGNNRLSHPCEFYLNNGNGTFSNISAQSGLNFEGFVKGCAWGDVNNDGLPDLYVSLLGEPNRLYLNRGGTSTISWRFEEIAESAGVTEPQRSFSTWFFDYDNDGYEDIFVSGYDAKRLTEVAKDAALEYLGLPEEAETPRLFHNNGDLTFSDVTSAMGLDKAIYGMGCNFGDLDNDGWLDFYIGTGAPDFRALVPNRMFRNLEGRGFEDLTMNGFGHIQKGHGIAFGDLDNDGDQDIYCVMGGSYEGDLAQNVLFENPGFERSWITLVLEGSESNRSAIGARIHVRATNPDGSTRELYRVVNTGGSYGSESLQQEIGLGDAQGSLFIEIIWPNGKQEVFNSVPLNRFLRIKEGTGTFKEEKRAAVSLTRIEG